MSDDNLVLDFEDMDDLGEFTSFEAYVRSMLEIVLYPGLIWILDYLDYSGVQRRMEEQDQFAFHLVGGRLYRESLS